MNYNDDEILKDKNNGLKISELIIKYSIKSVKTIYDIIKRNGRKKIIANKRYTVNEKYFEIIDNEEKSYWLGFLYADGYVRLKNGRSGELRLKLQRNDKEHIELFKYCLLSTHKIIDIVSNVKIDDKVYESECSSVSIYNTKLVNDLINIGCTNNKTFTIKFPKIDENLIRHFIRGYFDGDGCIDKNGKVSIISASFDFLDDVNKILNKQNINLNINKVDNHFVLAFRDKNKVKKFYNYLYDNSNIYLKRKQIKFK